MKTHKLPNGMCIHHVNQHETEFLYREIFTENVYLRNGISLRDGACVFDIGANIGMFTLYVKHRFPNAKVYAFEPIPDLYEIIKANVAPFGNSVKVFPNGLSDTGKEAVLTFYPGYSIMSGFHADDARDSQLLASMMRQQMCAGAVKTKPMSDDHVTQMANYTLRQAAKINCAMTTITQVIASANVDHIDLLKIDAEKSEIEILRGIADGDWPKIRQIVLEAHNSEQAAEIETLLTEKGFEFFCEQEKHLIHSSVYNYFAVKRSPGISDTPNS